MVQDKLQIKYEWLPVAVFDASKKLHKICTGEEMLENKLGI